MVEVLLLVGVGALALWQLMSGDDKKAAVEPVSPVSPPNAPPSDWVMPDGVDPAAFSQESGIAPDAVVTFTAGDLGAGMVKASETASRVARRDAVDAVTRNALAHESEAEALAVAGLALDPAIIDDRREDRVNRENQARAHQYLPTPEIPHLSALTMITDEFSVPLDVDGAQEFSAKDTGSALELLTGAGYATNEPLARN